MINCVGTWTYLTASLELPEVRAACEAASHYFVDLFELQAAAGRRLAELSGAESGMVTSGSAGAISAGTAACIAGSDPKKIYQLPDTTGMKGEVAFLGPRTPWDSCIRLAGAKLVVAPTVNDLPAALTSQTAMVYTTWGDERLQSDPQDRQARRRSGVSGPGRAHSPVFEPYYAWQRRASIFFVSAVERVCVARKSPEFC